MLAPVIDWEAIYSTASQSEVLQVLLWLLSVNASLVRLNSNNEVKNKNNSNNKKQYQKQKWVSSHNKDDGYCVRAHRYWRWFHITFQIHTTTQDWLEVLLYRERIYCWNPDIFDFILCHFSLRPFFNISSIWAFLF